MKLNLHIEVGEQKILAKEIQDKFKEMWKEKGEKIKDLKEVDLYFKPEEMACYYVVNKTGETGKITL